MYFQIALTRLSWRSKKNLLLAPFDPQGGNVTPATTTATFNQSHGTLPTPTRDSYAFLGWWTGTNDTGAQITGTTLTTTDAHGTLTFAYEYNATGTLIIADLDSVYSLKFTNATTGTLTL